MLSAQCTDARVNKVTPALFAALPTPAAMAAAPIETIEALVRTTGFFRNKAKNLKGAAQRITEVFHGEVPSGMDDLLTLPGVARKTANVVMGTAFGEATGVVVDTHVFRLAHRLGWSKGKTPVHVERDLMALFPREAWIDLSHVLIHHGRRICAARKPRCGECPVRASCPSDPRLIRPVPTPTPPPTPTPQMAHTFVVPTRLAPSFPAVAAEVGAEASSSPRARPRPSGPSACATSTRTARRPAASRSSGPRTR